MKLFIAVLSAAWVLAGCNTRITKTAETQGSAQTSKSSILDDPKVRYEILTVAIDGEKLQRHSGDSSSALHYAPHMQTPYTGWVKHMHANGQVWGLGHYLDGKLDGQLTLWRENGQKLREVHFKDGEKDGLWTLWYENGQKKEEGHYNGGKKDGLWISWQENGRKWIEQNLKDGQREGATIYYNKYGTEDFRETYKDGIRVKDMD